MVRNFQSDNVFEMIELSDWDNFSGEESVDDVDEHGERLDPLDIEKIEYQ